MTKQTEHEDRPRACPDGEALVAYLRGEAREEGEDGREAVERHLASCAFCRDLLAGLRETLDRLEAARPAGARRDLAPAVLAATGKAACGGDDVPCFPLARILCQSLVRIAAGVLVAVGVGYIAYQALTPSARPEHPRAVVLAGHDSVLGDEHIRARAEGVSWLVSAQDGSGKWAPERWGGRPEYAVGLTGMALMTLAAAEAPQTADVAAAIDRAVDYLLAQQAPDGRFGPDFDAALYNHAIAGVALFEAYARTQRADLVDPLRQAMAFIRKRQLPSGGWGYSGRATEAPNTSISTWPLRALLLASRTGWPDESHALPRALAWFVSVMDENGHFGYGQPPHAPDGSDALTAMGAYCVLRAAKAGVPVAPGVVRRVEQALARQARTAREPTDFYRTYFRVCALKEAHIERWTDSLALLRQDLLDKRERIGPEKGSWSPRDPWGRVGGRIYSTAMAALSL